MTLDSCSRTNAPQQPQTPRGVAVSGILFASLFLATIVLVRIAVPADPADPGEWLADPDRRHLVQIALKLVPFTGIAFLWYMGVLRSRIGLLEDRFFATVFLGSGLLFVAMLFGSAVVSTSLLDSFQQTGRLPAHSDTYAIGRRASYSLMITYALKMAAVFMFVTSSIGLRTGVLPRWLSGAGFAFGLVLLVIITDFAWIALLFPMWVLMVSIYLLIEDISASKKSQETQVLQ